MRFTKQSIVDGIKHITVKIILLIIAAVAIVLGVLAVAGAVLFLTADQ